MRQAEAEKAKQKVAEAKAKLEKILCAEGALADGVSVAEHEAKAAAESVNRASMAVIADEAEDVLRSAIAAQARAWVLEDYLSGFAGLYERRMPQEWQSRLKRLKRGDRQSVAQIENPAHGDYAQWKMHIAGVHRRIGRESGKATSPAWRPTPTQRFPNLISYRGLAWCKSPAELKLTHLARGCRPRCGAKTRSGKPCRAQALTTGFCAVHSGIIPGGPQTPEARERQRERARETMTRLWTTRWANGRPLSQEARDRIAEAQRRRSPESRYPSEETRRKISEGRKRFGFRKAA